MKTVVSYKAEKFHGHKIILTGLFLVVFVQPIVIKFFGQYSIGAISYIDDIFYLLSILIVFKYANELFKLTYVKYAIFSYAIFVVLGIISAFMVDYTKSVGQVLLQIVLDFKFLFFLLLFYLYEPSWEVIKKFEKYAKIALVVGVPLCIIQWLFPSLYTTLFYNEGTKFGFSVAGYNLPRLAGIFWHPYLTSFFTCITSFYFIYISKSRLYASLSLIQLLLTFQRQEIVTFFLLLAWVMYLYKGGVKAKLQVILATGSILFLGVCFADEITAYFDTTIRSMDLNNLAYSEEPRVTVYWHGFLLAIHHFPFGVGFGNFGGIAAVKYDAILYYLLHFDQFWWFGEEDFLTDTYYPHVYAEAGFIGFVFYVFCLWFVFKLFISPMESLALRGAVIFLLLFLFVVGLTSPVLNSPFALSLIGFLLAITKKVNKELFFKQELSASNY